MLPRPPALCINNFEATGRAATKAAAAHNEKLKHENCQKHRRSKSGWLVWVGFWLDWGWLWVVWWCGVRGHITCQAFQEMKFCTDSRGRRRVEMCNRFNRIHQ